MDKEENSDNKHSKYYRSYKPNELFWGIGIENETYLEIPCKEKIIGSFYKCQKQERYSVDYYKSYYKDYFNRCLDTLIDVNKEYSLPLLINGHELTRNDLSGQSITNYDKGSTPNKKFSGTTVFEYMKNKDIYFKDEHDKSFCFDGDTIEFMTQNFYKTTIQEVIAELLYHKKTFLNKINKLNLPVACGEMLEYPKENHGFARFTTNKKNLAIFNNGTYHFNFTLPTMLDNNGLLMYKNSFISRHSKAIRIIQLLEPFFIAVFGTADILSRSSVYSKRFPKGSQRVAASRYIGAGTYDTGLMVKGKLLQTDLSSCEPLWYKELYKQIHYAKNDKIGFDINFNKFRNHGIELRFFDWFPENKLEEILHFIVNLLDHSESVKNIINPINIIDYNNIMYKAILDGKDATLTRDEIIWLKTSLNIKLNIKDRNIVSIYRVLKDFFKNKYKYDGPCGKYMLERPTQSCCFSAFKKLNIN